MVPYYWSYWFFIFFQNNSLPIKELKVGESHAYTGDKNKKSEMTFPEKREVSKTAHMINLHFQIKRKYFYMHTINEN